MKNIVVVLKQRKGEWRGALIVDGNFQDALTGGTLSDMVVDAVGPALSLEYPDGQTVNITVNLSAPQEQ